MDAFVKVTGDRLYINALGVRPVGGEPARDLLVVLNFYQASDDESLDNTPVVLLSVPGTASDYEGTLPDGLSLPARGKNCYAEIVVNGDRVRTWRIPVVVE